MNSSQCSPLQKPKILTGAFNDIFCLSRFNIFSFNIFSFDIFSFDIFSFDCIFSKIFLWVSFCTSIFYEHLYWY